MQTYSLIHLVVRSHLCAVVMFAWFTASMVTQKSIAQDATAAPRWTLAEAKQLVTEGDRLADQADYSGAVEKYTEAYHTIVSRIRGQEFERRVLPNLLTRTELGKEILHMVQKEYTPEELALMDASYKAFGLMPREMNSKDLMTKLLTEQVGGFYDPENKRMVLVREDSEAKQPGFFERLLGTKPAFDKEEQKTTLAHEMTHALQDQLYGLQAMQKSIEKDDDMMLAFSALVEGDATLLMFDEMDDSTTITEMDPAALRATFTVMSFMLPVAGGESYRKAPAIFRETLIFPYLQGMLFNIAVAGKKGWPAIDQAYASPPVSTEQILHPEKYTGTERDQPQLVELPDLSGTIKDPWKHLGGNCLGELQTSILLRKLRSARRAAAGWDGDRFEVYSQADGRLGLVFVSVWDSPQDAEEFAKSFRQYREPQSDSDQKQANAAEDGQADKDKADKNRADKNTEATAADSATVASSFVEVHNDQVWIVEGFAADTQAAIAEQLKHCKFTEKTFPGRK